MIITSNYGLEDPTLEINGNKDPTLEVIKKLFNNFTVLKHRKCRNKFEVHRSQSLIN